MEFYGFSETGARVAEDGITTPPEYMLIRLLHDTEGRICLPGLPPSVVPIKTVSFKYGSKGKNVTLEQFPVTLAYAITDYKCQGRTFPWVIVDLKRPRRGRSSAMSAYVQLSRAIALERVSIIRPFDDKDLREPLEPELVKELEWQNEMAEKTKKLYRF